MPQMNLDVVSRCEMFFPMGSPAREGCTHVNGHVERLGKKLGCAFWLLWMPPEPI